MSLLLKSGYECNILLIPVPFIFAYNCSYLKLTRQTTNFEWVPKLKNVNRKFTIIIVLRNVTRIDYFEMRHNTLVGQDSIEVQGGEEPL